MSEKKNSQTQQTVDAWRRMLEEQMERLDAMFEELGRLEARSMEQTRAAIDEGAKLMKESLAYATEISAEWRRLTLDAAKRSRDYFQVPLA